jgi:hypothetical protein
MNHSLTRRQFLLYGSALAAGAAWGRLPQACAAEADVFESRAILDEGLNWASTAGAEKVCERIARAGFNVFIPCVWHGRGTVWPSKLAPWDSHHSRAAGIDPLETLLKTAARYKLEVHPWFTVALRQRDFFHEFYDEGTPAGHFDVHKQAFREFISALVLEVAANYPVHGINLDYVYSGAMCSSVYCQDDYRSKTGRNLLVDLDISRVPVLAPKALIAWQEAAVGDIVRRISAGVRKINPLLVLSVTGDPGHPILPLQGQDTVKWADEGTIDVIYNMHGEPNPDFDAIRAVKARMKRPEAMAVGSGNYEETGKPGDAVPRKAARVVELVRTSLEISRSNGVAVYLYSMLSDGQIELLRRSVFSRPARPRWVRAASPA